MLRIQATIGLTTYYFASEALDYANRYWEPRISNAFQISREFNSADKTGNKIRSVDISLDNRDGFFNSIYTTSGLVNGKFVLYFNEGDNVVKTFTGRVNKINSFGDDISLTLREVGYEYLTRKFPDAQIAYDYYSASGINDSWNAIPIHLGTVNRYPCPWVNLFESHFIIGSGPIHAVKKIYFDKTVVYDSSTGQNGYKPTPDSPEIKFSVFKGARAGYTDIVEGVESSYPGFAYIQLYKIVDAVEQPADPVNPDGEAVQIYVDIEGLQNEAGNGAERNPAQILYQFFTKPYTAEEGYGLAVDSDDLDFASAITECAIQGFKIDGSVDNTTDFGEWVDEILRCCRGQLYENNGKISVRIDAAAASPTIHFDETGELGYNCIVDTWNEPERDAQTNRVRLSYSWNFENSNFNKKPSYNQESPIGDTNLQNLTHKNRIQKWNTETLEYKLIKDDTTAHKLAQYYLNNIVKQLITTSLTTEVDIPNTVDAGTVVKVTSPKFGWNQKLFRITNISRAEENTEIKLKEYDASIFTFIDPGTGVETDGSQYSVYNIPAKPELTSLSVVNELLADGSTQTRINVNFVAPTENSQLVALYYKPSGGTEADFKPLDTVLSSAGTMSAIWKGIESGNYNFRLVTISPVGIYSDLSIVSGDKHYYGQPGSQGTVALTGDTIKPGKPSIDDFLLVQGAVTLHFNIPTGFPSDFSHFAVYRKLDGGSLLPLDMKYTGRLFTDTDVAGYVSRQYSIVAYDKSNNPSESSDLTVALTPLKIATNDIQAGAITSETITSNAIYGKCFMTNCNVGTGVAGVIFDIAGIRAYSTTANTFNMDAMTGNVSMTGTITALAGNIGGFTIDPIEGLHAGCTTTRVQMKPGVGIWAGATAIGDAPFSVTQAGVLKSTSGTIGGFSIGTNILCSTPAAGCSVGMSACNTSGAVAFWAGCSTVGSAPFRVTNTGAITACSGTIGGWTLASASLASTNAYLYSGAANTARLEMGTGATAAGVNSANAGTDISFWAGSTHANRATAPFRVTAAGSIMAIDGTIGGWNITSARICKAYATGVMDLNTDYSTMYWYRNDGTRQIGAFIGQTYNGTAFTGRCGISFNYGTCILFEASVNSSSVLTAQIAGWNFNSTQIYSTGCGLILCNTGAIQTGLFQAGNQGWKIDSVGNAEFNNICARGAIRTAVFIKDQISVIGGCAMIRPASILSADDVYSASSNIYYVDDNTQFAVNDLIRIKSGAGDFWGKVTASATGCITVGYCNGNTSGNITKGQAVVNYGSCLGCGGIMLNGQCPYIDLYTHAGLPWSALESRVRIGNLAGWGSFDTLTPTYGIAAGSPTGQYMTYDSISGVLDIAGNINVKSTLPLSMPAGAVGEWSVKGATTTSIRLSGGIVDITGNGLNGTASSQASVTDIFGIGKAILFNGSGSSYATIPHNALIDFERTNSFSISIIVRRVGNPTTVSKLFTKGSGHSYAGYGITDYYTENQLRFYLSAGSTYLIRDLNYPTGYTSGTPITITMTYDGTTSYAGLKIYINGELASADNVSNTLTTSIKTTSQVIIGDYFNGAISLPKVFGRALTAEEVKTMYLLGKESESGTITAERIKTGVLSSLNWGTSAGSCFNMNDGTFKFGGESAPKLSWNGTTLNVVGNITITGGSGIGNFSDAGALATVDNLDGVADGTTYKRTTQNEKTGAGYGYNGLTTNGTVYGIARPDTRNTNQLPTWYARGTFNEFKSSTVIGITGANTYGNLTTEKPWLDSSGGYVVQTYSDGSGVWERRSTADHSAWQAWYKVTDSTGSLVSRVVPAQNAAPSGSGLYLGSDYMGFYNGSVWKTYMDNSGNFYLGGSAAGCGLAWNAATNCLTVCGCITSSAGTIGGWTLTGSQIIQNNIGGITNRKLEMNASVASIHWWQGSASSGAFLGQIYNAGWTGRYGLAVVQNAVSIFEASYDTSNNLTAKIAGWNFNATCIYSNNILINNNGSIYSNNYAVGSAGWCINGAGKAEFSDVTVRGVVCATSGCIGCFSLVDGTLSYNETNVDFGAINITSSSFGIGTSMTASGISSYYICPVTNVFLCGRTSYFLNFSARRGLSGCCSYLRSDGSCFSLFTTSGAYDATCLCSSFCVLTCISGDISANSPLRICAYGGNSCFAMCTNGQIQSSYTYSTVCSYSPVVCATTCVRTPFVYGCSPASAGVRGEAAQYCGVYGVAAYYGVYGYAAQYCGVYGVAAYYGVYGYAATSYPVAGNGAYYNASTRTLKQGFEDVMVLPGLRSICIQKWSWSDINQRGFDEFITPTAEDVANAFGLTFKDDGYYTLDGIALKAAQEIDQNVQVHDTCIEFLKEENVSLKSCVQEMAYKLKLIEERLGIN